MIEDIFNDEDAEKIQNLPLLLTNEVDCLVWSDSNNGAYTIRSTYYSIMEEILDTCDLKVAGSWLHIWKLQVPPRIKHFIWRLQRCCVPTRQRLQEKGIQCSSECIFCTNEIENTWHLFVTCHKAQEIWKHVGLLEQRASMV